MNKNRHIISEIQSFFKENDATAAIQHISRVMKSIVIQDKVIGTVKNHNCKFNMLQVLELLILFPFFSVKNPLNFESSSLGKIFECRKDMFYRFMNNGAVNWRRIVYSVFRQLRSKISSSCDPSSEPRCLIIDDTDLPKTGYKIENIGKVFSHTMMKPVLAFKAMFLCYTDGKTQSIVDFSIHGEEGRREDMPQGLTKKQAKCRFSKERNSDENISTRCDEYLSSKISTAIKMLRRALVEGIRFDYLLLDSWFTCSEFVKFVKSRHFNCHLIGMIKMGKTKYKTSLGEKTASEIIRSIIKSKNVKYRRSIGYYTAQISAKYAGTNVHLFFYRKTKNGNWNALLTTDMTIDDIRAFKLYSRRWVIEVAHKEMKQNLKLGKSQCRDFAGQIAAVSICAIQYNILGFVKRMESYETIGGLFAEITKNSVELSVADRIWLLIVDVVNVIAEEFEIDAIALTKKIISSNGKIQAVQSAFMRLNVAG